MKFTVTIGIKLMLFASLMLGYTNVPAQEKVMNPMPESAWLLLEAAQGIQVGGPAGQQANIQIIFDANCPYCARLHTALKREYSNVVVRWVPVAYFRADSGTMAAAILHSKNPAGSLDLAFSEYDFKARHSGYPAPAGTFYLSAENLALQRSWRTWGGFTPMIIIRDKQGRVLKTGVFGSETESLRIVVDTAMPPTRVLQPYRPIPKGID